jgi:hypothetical protein
LLIPDTDPDFFYPFRIPGSKTNRIPDPGVKKASDPRSATLEIEKGGSHSSPVSTDGRGGIGINNATAKKLWGLFHAFFKAKHC